MALELDCLSDNPTISDAVLANPQAVHFATCAAELAVENACYQCKQLGVSLLPGEPEDDTEHTALYDLVYQASLEAYATFLE
ncbi:MAG: hypothetical protein WCG26_14865 [Chloroflexales bacterium]